MKATLWKFINSAFGIWLLTSLVGGFSFWQFERYIDVRDRERTLSDKYERLALEFEGRLSQYSSWWLEHRIKTSKSHELEEEFISCVSVTFLKNSLLVFSGPPNHTSKPSIVPGNRNCESLPRFKAIFNEFSNVSTVGLLAEMHLISSELYPETWVIDPEDNALIPDKNAKYYSDRRTLLSAINAFLNPEVIIELDGESPGKPDIKAFRENFQDHFYNFGPAEFYYGDVFAG